MSTIDIDLIPDSGTLPRDEGAWLQVQFHLLEFMAAQNVELRADPTRIHVTAYGEPGDLVPPALLTRIEERCGTRLRQVPSEQIAAGDWVVADVDLLSVIRDGDGKFVTRTIDLELGHRGAGPSRGILGQCRRLESEGLVVRSGAGTGPRWRLTDAGAAWLDATNPRS